MRECLRERVQFEALVEGASGHRVQGFATGFAPRGGTADHALVFPLGIGGCARGLTSGPL